jgi:hypothetical protein
MLSILLGQSPQIWNCSFWLVQEASQRISLAKLEMMSKKILTSFQNRVRFSFVTHTKVYRRFFWVSWTIMPLHPLVIIITQLITTRSSPCLLHIVFMRGKLGCCCYHLNFGGRASVLAGLRDGTWRVFLEFPREDSALLFGKLEKFKRTLICKRRDKTYILRVSPTCYSMQCTPATALNNMLQYFI